MISVRKVDDEKDARRCLAAAERASMTPREWARRNGVDARSLNAWRINLGRRRAIAKVEPTALTLVEVVARPAGTAPAARDSATRYVLEIDGARFEFGDDVSAMTLRRVVEVLRSC